MAESPTADGRQSPERAHTGAHVPVVGTACTECGRRRAAEGPTTARARGVVQVPPARLGPECYGSLGKVGEGFEVTRCCGPCLSPSVPLRSCPDPVVVLRTQ